MTPRTEPAQPVIEAGLTLTVVQNALDEAWLESNDAYEIARPPDLAGHLHDALVEYLAIEQEAAALSPEPLDVERLAQVIAAAEGFPGQPSLKNRALAEYIVARLTPEPSDPA